MVKGISRQVIVVHSPDPKLFEQAIFILKEDAAQNGVTDEALLREAEQAIRIGEQSPRKRKLYYYGAFWTAIGALSTGLIWLITILL